jgi:hypothetical protein
MISFSTTCGTYQQSHVVILYAFGFIREVVAALVNRHHVVIRRERGHLVAERVPEIREAVDHYDEWVVLIAERGVVNFHAAGIGVAVFDAIFNVVTGGECCGE